MQLQARWRDQGRLKARHAAAEPESKRSRLGPLGGYPAPTPGRSPPQKAAGATRRWQAPAGPSIIMMAPRPDSETDEPGKATCGTPESEA
jgi:hypothetical protein